MKRRVPGAEFTPAFKQHRWDGYIYPGTHTKSGQFILGRGFLERVLHDLNATIVVPPPPSPAISLDLSGEDSLRDYQVEALEQIFRRRWGCVALATNAGKGAIIALSVQALAKHGRVLICCDEVSVFQALKEEVEKWSDISLGFVTAGLKVPPKEKVVLAMIPTLYRRVADPRWGEFFKGIFAVFLDEADKATAPSWRTLLQHLPNTHYRIGTSGTFPAEGTIGELSVHENIGPILIRVKNIELIERGISARAMVEFCPFEHEMTRPLDWKEMDGPTRRLFVHGTGIVMNDERHQFIKSLLEPGVPNAVVVNYLEHGRQLALVLPDSRFLSGDDPPEVRQAVLESFKRGDFKVLIVSKILDRGTNDLGHAVGLIFASGAGSDRQTLQRLGRGLRRAGGKEFLFLKDVIDRGNWVSRKPVDPIKYLDDASVRRVKLYNEEGFEVRIRVDTEPEVVGSV